MDVWWIRPESFATTELEARFGAWLTPAERSHQEQLRTAVLKHDYLAARALCRATLSLCAGIGPTEWQFRRSTHGKPAISEPAEFRSLQFNLTGTAGLIACAVSRAGAVGVDAEDTSRLIDAAQISKHFFSASEQAGLAKLAPDDRTHHFFELWVLKEAYLKGLGVGLSHPPNEFTIELDQHRNPRALNDWQFTLSRPTPHHLAATAILPGSPRAIIPVTWRNASTDATHSYFIHGSTNQ